MKTLERSEGDRAGDFHLIPGPALGALAFTAAAMAVMSVQDYFDHYSLWFTGAYVLLLGLAFVMVFRTPLARRPEEGQERAETSGEGRAGSWAAGAAVVWTAACFALSLLPGSHDKWLVGAMVLAGSLLTGALLWLRRGSVYAAVLPAIASYLLMISSPVPYMEHQWFPERNLVFELGVSAGYVLVAVPALVRMPPAWALGIYLAAGTFFRVLGIWQWELDPNNRDMIPLIHHGALSLLDGRHPYRIYFCDHDLPLTYLPLMWLSYLPAAAAGIDPRVTTILFALGSAVMIYLWKDGGGGRAPLLAAVAALWYFQAEVIWATVFAESAPYWLLVFVFLWAVARQRKAEAALLLGLMLATRHFAFLFVPFAAFWFLLRRRTRGGGRGKLEARGLAYPTVSGAMAALIVTPFVATSAMSFFFGTLHWLTSFGPARRTWWELQISLSPPFYAARLEHLLVWIQAALYLAVLAAFLVPALRRSTTAVALRGRLWVFFAISYLLFLLFNSLMWRHLHPMAIALIIFAVVMRLLPEPPAPREPTAVQRVFDRVFFSGRMGAAAVVAAALVVVVCGVIIGRGLYGFLERDDMVRDAGAVAEKLRPGDLLVDYAYFNAWPVLEGTPFPVARMEPEVTHSLRLRSQFPPAHERVVVVTSGKQFVLREDAPDLLGYMKLARTVQQGRLEVSFLENPHAAPVKASLSERFDWVRSVRIAAGGRTVSAKKIDGEFKFPAIDPRFTVLPANFFIQLADRRCVIAFPPRGAELQVELEIPYDARLWLKTALSDYALWSGLGPVRVELACGGLRKRFEHPNEQGFFVWHGGLCPAGRTVLVSISSERKKRRFFCFDVVTTQWSL